ncbi:DUF2808 domain-containing protein [Kovacikia minuta CCNUW1]|uniref:DUF2808 domain-containing protein n=1 Tax=Kovacikia minuta TaxID=2931930 RepID=UPI001CCF24D8|nr:DUF2808 domain-containing protein [Kovacikia minuta]UBF27046.1 DUF2808 domain-containing protein [Kovacikia minuta CCNUW1]
MNTDRFGLGVALAISVGCLGNALVSNPNMPAQAVQLSDGSVAFAQPPRLVGATATQKAPYISSRYYFTLNLLSDAGEPLQKVVITPEANVDYARFDLGGTVAFEGNRDRSEARLPIQDVTADPKTKAITITFDPPVSPGKTLTVGLYANRNPDTGGIYLYGVTAFPAGEKSYGQFLGYGRIQITNRWDGFFFR